MGKSIEKSCADGENLKSGPDWKAGLLLKLSMLDMSYHPMTNFFFFFFKELLSFFFSSPIPGSHTVLVILFINIKKYLPRWSLSCYLFLFILWLHSIMQTNRVKNTVLDYGSSWISCLRQIPPSPFCGLTVKSILK